MEVRGECVVVVAERGLARIAEAAAVVRDDAVAALEKRRKLFLPGASRERPAVNQDHRLPRAVVLVIEVDRARVFLSDRHVGHAALLSARMRGPTREGYRSASSAHAVLRPDDAARLRAVRAAIVVTSGLDAVAHDLAVAVLALGRQGVDRALKAVEDVPAAGQDDLESLVVVVPANVTDRHAGPPDGVPNRRGRSPRES